MLKPLAAIAEPDPRFAFSGAGDPADPWRRMELRDHHAIVASIHLPETAPEPLIRMFERARHAFLYAWFEYELTPLAEQQALACVEAALKLRYGTGRDGLAKLLSKAVHDGLAAPLSTAGLQPRDLAAYRNLWAHGHDGFGTPTTTEWMLRLCANLVASIVAGLPRTSEPPQQREGDPR